MSLANQKEITEYQEAIQATEDLESPAVSFAKTSDYKEGLAVQVNAVIKQNNTLLYLATKQSQKIIELEEKFDKLKQEIHTIVEKEVQHADLEDSISSLAKRLDSFSISGKLPVFQPYLLADISWIRLHALHRRSAGTNRLGGSSETPDGKICGKSLVPWSRSLFRNTGSGIRITWQGGE
ncbi:hypothetical protein Tco_0929297 [Tanacetum coccineum]